MCGHGEERRVKVWVLDHKGEKTSAYFTVYGYKSETNTVYQFRGCHSYGHACMKNCTIRQMLIYKDTWQIDRLFSLPSV